MRKLSLVQGSQLKAFATVSNLITSELPTLRFTFIRLWQINFSILEIFMLYNTKWNS